MAIWAFGLLFFHQMICDSFKPKCTPAVVTHTSKSKTPPPSSLLFLECG